MGFLDRLLGTNRRETQRSDAGTPRSADEQAVDRYRYLLRTAPPDAVEQAHTEAFAKLTPAQRQQVLQELGRELPESERASSAEPQALARMATRAELRQPGFLERTLGARGAGGGIGLGGMFAGSLLSSIAGTFIGTAIAHQFLGGFDDAQPTDSGDHHAAHDATDANDANDSADAQDDYGSGAEEDLGDGDFGDFGGGDMDV